MRSAGQYETVIGCLLSDSQQWNTLWNQWDAHLATIKQVLATFKEYDSLYTELMDPDEMLKGPVGMRGSQTQGHEAKKSIAGNTSATGDKLEQIRVQIQDPDPARCLANDPVKESLAAGDGELQSEHIKLPMSLTKSNIEGKSQTGDAEFRPEDLKVIKGLEQRIAIFESRCRTALSALDQETDKLIGLVSNAPQSKNLFAKTHCTHNEQEFNLVSIFEARKSIKMTEVSLSMAMSMKRLSWITVCYRSCCIL